MELVHMGLFRVYQPSVESDIRIEARFGENEEINVQIIEDDN